MNPQVYELRVRGTVPKTALDEIGAAEVGEEPPLTILRTEAIDQSSLHGLIERLRSLGLDLLEIRAEPVLDRPPVPRPPTDPALREIRRP